MYETTITKYLTKEQFDKLGPIDKLLYILVIGKPDIKIIYKEKK